MNGAGNTRAARKRYLRAGAALAALALIAIAALLVLNQQLLVLCNDSSGKIRFAQPLREGEQFSVSYTHSVNKSYVEEYYQPRGGVIYLLSLRYKSFGAGMASEADLSAGQTLRYEDGFMIIDGYEAALPRLAYNVDRAAGLQLHYRGREIGFRGLDQPGQALRITVAPRWKTLLGAV